MGLVTWGAPWVGMGTGCPSGCVWGHRKLDGEDRARHWLFSTAHSPAPCRGPQWTPGATPHVPPSLQLAADLYNRAGKEARASWSLKRRVSLSLFLGHGHQVLYCHRGRTTRGAPRSHSGCTPFLGLARE